MKPIFRAVYVTDTHFRASNPRSRVDDYSGAVLAKFDWVVNYAIEQKVDAIIHGGDWFDTFEASESVKIRLMWILNKAREHKIPVVTTPGSHDVHGYNLDTLGRASLGVLEAGGMVTVLRRGDSWIWMDPAQGDGVSIIGCPHSIDLDSEDDRYYIQRSGVDGFVILIAHGNLVDHELPDGFDHTRIENVKVDADLVLSGHYHAGYALHRRVDGVTFANPGSLARVDDSRRNRARKPLICYIEVWPKSGGVRPPVTVEPIPVSIAADDVFGDKEPEVDDVLVDVSKLVDYFRDETDAAGTVVDLDDLIRRVRLDDVDPELVNRARAMVMELIQQYRVEEDDIR